MKVQSVVALAMVGSMLIAGCTAPEPEIEFTHVHDIIVEPVTGDVYLGTHYGVVHGQQSGKSWSWRYAGEERFDYMGFTQDGGDPSIFYSSGHPNIPQEFGGVHLGLRRSTDAAESWEQQSLKGQVDFHALTGVPGLQDVVIGYWQGAIRSSSDGGATWTDFDPPAPDILSLAASQTAVYAGAVDGLYRSNSATDLSGWTRVEGSSEPDRYASLGVSANGMTLFASSGDYRTGQGMRSTDGGATWELLTEPALAGATRPIAFAVDPSDAAHVFASTSGGMVFESEDAGATWRTIRTP